MAELVHWEKAKGCGMDPTSSGGVRGVTCTMCLAKMTPEQRKLAEQDPFGDLLDGFFGSNPFGGKR